MQENFRFVLDKMAASGFTMPAYVNYDKKTASAGDAETSPASYEDRAFPIDSQENVWLSAVKLACDTDLSQLEKDSYKKQVYDAAERYGIRGDLDKAAEFVLKSETEPQGIRTVEDWQKAQTWLIKHAEQVSPDIVTKLANHLLDKTAEIGYIPSLVEQYDLREMAGRDPMIPEMQKYAERNCYRLANGNYYTTNQFATLSYDEIDRCVPDLLKTASLGMPVFQPDTFAAAVSQSDKAHADIITTLLANHGQHPIHSERRLPVEIDDRTLAEL
jgi:hypothetical protein